MLDKKKEADKIKLKGQLKLYIQWPAIVAVLLVLVNIWVYVTDRKAGILMGMFVVVYIIVAGWLYLRSKTVILKDLVEFAAQYGIVQNTLLKELTVPYAILLDDGKTLWINDLFKQILGGRPRRDVPIGKYIPELNSSIFPKEDNDTVEMDVYLGTKEFKAELRRVSVEGFNDTGLLLQMPAEKEYFIAVHLQDVTELNQYIKANEEQRLLAGLIYIDNYDEVMNFLSTVNHDCGLGIGARHITVSTCGVVPRIYDFAKEHKQYNLALSLHAPNDELRSRLMPVNHAYPLKELMEAVSFYAEENNRRLTFEYILLKGVNDQPQHVKQLAKLMRGLNAYVNLIPYNAVDEKGFQSVDHASAMVFYDALMKQGIRCTIRKEHGGDIDAACGQLRVKHMRKDGVKLP